MTRAIAAVVLGAALWLSTATFAPVTAGGSWRVALAGWPSLAAALAAAVLVVALRPPRSLVGLLPLAAVLLPWAPGIDAGLVYAGPLMLLAWAAAVSLTWGPDLTAWIQGCGCAASPGRATVAALLIAFASTSLAAWRVAPLRPGGDEPHYLIMTQSLLQDGDLRIENNHAARDFAAYTDTDINPQYLTRGQDGQIYPIHAPGLPAIVIPAFAVGGYAGVVLFLLVIMAAASALVWRLAWMATGDMAAAWFGWAAVAASCTWVFQSFLVFPEAIGGAVVACGLWLVLRLDRGAAPAAAAVVLVGAALALLPWLHTRFAALAAGLGLMIVLRLWPLGLRPILLFLAAPVTAAVAWFGFFYAIYGTPSPLAPWGGPGGSSATWMATGLVGTLFDQQFGLLPYAPVLAAGLAGLVAGTAEGWRRATRLQVLVLLVVPYLAATTSYAMWWGGLSVPARLLTALLPLLAPAAAVLWHRASHPAARALLAAALGWTIFVTITIVFVDRGGLAWNVRQHKAGLWFEWAVPLMQWTESLPAFFRADDSLGRESLPLAPFYRVTLVWMAAVAAAGAAGALAARLTSRASAVPVTIAALVLAMPMATVIALRVQGADAAAPVRAQMAFLDRLSAGDVIVVDLSARRVVSEPARLPGMRLTMPARRSGGENVALSVGPVPAGTYRITGEPGGAAGSVVVGRARFPVATLGDAPVEIVLPVSVAAIEVRGAEGRAVALEPVAVPLRRVRETALRAARYGGVTVYFTDNHVYAEREAFWVRGARHANIVLQASPGVSQAHLEIRNGPVANRVTVVGAGAPYTADVLPGATFTVPVTLDDAGVARLRVVSTAGFVPAEVEPGNGDRRFLGVYVRVRLPAS